MKIFLKNIAKIQEAAIEIKGITVIAGENNTGKSTVGKALYAVYNTFADIDNKIERSKRDNIRQILNKLDLAQDQYIDRVMQEQGRQEKENIKSLLYDLYHQRSIVKEGTSRYWKDTFYGDEEPTDEMINKVYLTLNLSKEEILKSILISNLKGEFGNQVNNIFRDETGEIRLEIKNEICSFEIKENKIEKITNPLRLELDSVYLDDPFILDRGGFIFDIDHRVDLNTKLFRLEKKSSEEIDINKILREQKLEEIERKLNMLCSGEIQIDFRTEFVYKYPKSGKSLDLSSLSTGLKTFVILKTLISKGYIEEKGLIILDEPEVHLHPAWQIILAELIVMLQKEFNLHVLINSHSPYFINAIEVYSRKHETSEKTRYYMAELQAEGKYEEEMVDIIDVSGELNRIYNKLSKPFDDLEKEDYARSLEK